ncbi:MAG: (2Fe-2S) ferredoxin domain-containing protein [Sphingomonas sp.]|uniref:(2Fe-2S) ferredoxin domain-containing protein n=1 Tax=Sphingomonas sp. TaxID=28214 RepID=UPI001ACAEB70|nr:(2Fe-2S) ferredoxin domain-containing protein [Sphingomonas sp.]MBN8807654.1 (2Fe-2S) ferredoxin domain-containing protein [Sphingomonas sp.]
MGRGVASRWNGAVLVCGKCSKKLDGGFGPKRRWSLAKALRKAFGLKKGRKAPFGVIETRCLGICPRNAVTLIDTAHPDMWRVVPVGADIAALGRDLGLGASDQPPRRAINDK